MSAYKNTITITFGDQAENHVGMQKLGVAAESGIGVGELLDLCAKKGGYIVNLAGAAGVDVEDACVWVLPGKIPDPDHLMKDLESLTWDSKAKMYGRVVNKKARHNIVIAGFSQEPDYEAGKGRVVAWEDVPRVQGLKWLVEDLIEREDLVAEGNHYYDSAKCGIGFHGDTERRLVVGCRFGAPMDLEYQWYLRSEPVGERVVLKLNHGDMYVMSSKAVGFDWKSRSKYTLRHGTGTKFTNPGK